MKPNLTLRRDPEGSDAPFAPALRHLAEGQTEAAIRFTADAHARYPDDPRGADLLGACLYEAGRFDEARACFARAANLAPGASAYAYHEGAALLMADRPREAGAAFLRSLNGDELLPAAHYWAWAALNRLGRTNDAITRLRMALHADPAQAYCAPAPRRADLPSVTLCAIDCKVPDLAARSMRRSLAQCRFGEAKLFTSRACAYEGIEVVRIDPIDSIEDYSRFVMKSLAAYVGTQYALVTQWDGYVIDAGAWTDDFLACDYIGARWSEGILRETGSPPEYDVGNGGFSLRSDIFLGAGTDAQLTATHPEDTQMCRTYRPYLERAYGIRFADAQLADRFSFEIYLPDERPFGFHGSFNLAQFEADPKWMRFAFLGPDPFAG